MNNQNTYEHLKLIIGRYDHYLDVVNTKGSFLITIYTFLITISLFNIDKLIQVENCYLFTIMVIVLSLGMILLFWGIYYVLKAVFPWLKSENETQKKSLIFFGSVSMYENKDYISKMNSNNEADNINDLSDQVHILSKALTHKFELIGKSMNKLYIIGGIVIIVMILKIIEEAIR